MDNGLHKANVCLPDDWLAWLKEMARIRDVPMQAIICQALMLWSEQAKGEQETKIASLETEWADIEKKIDALEARKATFLDPDAAQRAKLKGLAVPNSAEAA